MIRAAPAVAATLLAVSLLPTDSAQAAPPPTCLLHSQPGTAMVSGQHDLSPDGFWVAIWDATVACPGTPLDGTVATLTQQIRRRIGDDGLHGPVAGPMRIVIEFTSAGIFAQFEGRARGNGDCSSGPCVVDLDLDARSPGGRKLRGIERFTVDTTTLEVTGFTSTLFVYDREFAAD